MLFILYIWYNLYHIASMITNSTYLVPGLYQYSYPTFVDTPQQICVHFLTPDRRSAFVSYPHHPNRKAAQLISLSWFQSVKLVKLEGQPQLMDFLEFLCTGLFRYNSFEFQIDDSLADNYDGYRFTTPFAA